MKNDNNNCEQGILKEFVLSILTEQKKSRRWGIFFKSLTFLYLFVILWMTLSPNTGNIPNMGHIGGGHIDHTAIVKLNGLIAEDEKANAEDLIASLQAAAKNSNVKGIIIQANSPGGSPVQSANVYDEIRRIKKDKPGLPIYAVVGDVCASGCYYIASATDKIFVSQASVVGSIGVIMEGFGFVGVMQKAGVERRLLTAGSHKAMLDPFSPPDPTESAYMKALLDGIHQQFITAVKAGRGSRLKESPDTFSGLVWTGENAIKIGMADGIGTAAQVAKDIVGAEETVNYTKKQLVFDKLFSKIGTVFQQSLRHSMAMPAFLPR